jgi:hypothetical protein
LNEHPCYVCLGGELTTRETGVSVGLNTRTATNQRHPSTASGVPAAYELSYRIPDSETHMAKNKTPGDDQRKGAVKARSQIKNPVTGTWTKRDDKSGKFMDVKADPKPFKGVRKEKQK